MNSMPETNQTGDRINDKPSEIQADAMVALVPFNPQTHNEVVSMLAFWRRRPEMTDADVTAVADRLFPAEQVRLPRGGRLDVAHVRELARRAADAGFAINPDGDPSYLVERINSLLAEGVEPTPPESEWAEPPACKPWCTNHTDDGQYRECGSEDVFVPQADNRVVSVSVEATFDRVTGLSTPVAVRLEDHLFRPHHARQLARLLIAAADLADA